MAAAKTYSLNETPIAGPVFPSPVNNEFGWETTDYANPAIPCTLSEVRNQIKLSEEQINNGQYVTAREAIEHFYQL